MYIEALINGEFLTRSLVPDEFLGRDPDASFQDSAQFHENIVKMYLDQFRKRMDKFIQPGLQIEYRLVFISKPTIDIDEPETYDAIPSGQ
jgi:hypothetical protein